MSDHTGERNDGAFAEKLKELGLNVERIAAVHGRTATIAELRLSLEKMSAKN